VRLLAHAVVAAAAAAAPFLGGCAALPSGQEAASPKDSVRVVRSSRLWEDSETREAPPEVADAEFVHAMSYVHGGFVDLEDHARDFAVLNDADIILIRPSVPHRMSMSRTRIEAWRSKASRTAAREEPAEAGRTLVPPADTTMRQRHRNINECFAEARADPARELSASEKAELAGNDTRGFFISGRPLIDKHERPTKSGFTYRRVVNPGPASPDLYVQCFLKRGYRWATN
jgi:hypothetical protein